MSFEISKPFRDPAAARSLVEAIRARSTRPARLMEFCGGHTHAILRFGILTLLPPTVSLRSGPGCSVCVTSTADLDRAILLTQVKDVILTTFGDMVRVPASAHRWPGQGGGGRRAGGLLAAGRAVSTSAGAGGGSHWRRHGGASGDGAGPHRHRRPAGGGHAVGGATAAHLLKWTLPIYQLPIYFILRAGVDSSIIAAGSAWHTGKGGR